MTCYSGGGCARARVYLSGYARVCLKQFYGKGSTTHASLFNVGPARGIRMLHGVFSGSTRWIHADRSSWIACDPWITGGSRSHQAIPFSIGGIPWVSIPSSFQPISSCFLFQYTRIFLLFFYLTVSFYLSISWFFFLVYVYIFLNVNRDCILEKYLFVFLLLLFFFFSLSRSFYRWRSYNNFTGFRFR